MISGIDEILQQAVADETVPGIVALAGDRNGLLYEGAAGRLGIDSDEPALPETIVWAASMTKAIVSVAALQLIEAGALELEQPVADVLPEFGRLQVLEGFDGDTPRLRPPIRLTTIRHLLTHTSGLGYWFTDADVLRYHELTGTPYVNSGRRAALQVPLVADPGTRWVYGISHDWLGQVIEAAADEDLATYCGEHIFEPLGMPDTSFSPSDSQRARMMKMHLRQADGGLAAQSAMDRPHTEFWSGGGGAYTSGRDYLRLMRALLRGGELDRARVLRSESVERMFRDQLAGAIMPTGWKSPLTTVSNDFHFPPVKHSWGLGIHVVHENIPNSRRAGSGDWAGLGNCYYWIDRSTGVAGITLTQVLPFFDARVRSTATEFERAIYKDVSEPGRRA
ncbi:MAG: beta-lactamase family protein [Solirubrobacterales bacterium]|nr:beta-lactamase family protein [Solirubrobacterales bacterium]